MPLDALTPKEKTLIKDKLNSLNARYGSGGTIVAVNWGKKTVKIDGGKTPERGFELTHGAKAGTFKLKFAGQQGVTKALKTKVAA
jgi:hypothetical protein